MRCYCCNKVLTSQESTRRFKQSNEFVDMCNTCLSTIDEDVEVTDGYQEDDDNDEENS